MAPITYRPVNWYDLTGYYDMVHRDDTRREVLFLERVMSKYLDFKCRRILEPACGSGRLILPLARRGYSLAGFDSNPLMLQAAARKIHRFQKKVRLFRAELDDFLVRGKFDMAFCLISTFRHLLSEQAARRHFELIRRVLRPGGVYVLGLHLSEYGVDRMSRERWTGRQGKTQVVCNLQTWPPDPKSRLEQQRLRVIVTRQSATARYEYNYVMRSYSARQLKKTLARVPGLTHVGTYDFSHDIDMPRRLTDDQLDFILVLKKKI